ncbi:hydrogenase/urease nickel incorporation protein HypA [Helicobacter anatolicus]|uniref:hydrogenase/urease nickel incorporation protein HypA n=1 Tax=Helicobacter anatolicus TaxID=2905874 RepID=UPI001E40929F|nr:hydrogenase/urease nickel incorporation protein HypA [Helicobacter anatolicus]MCE3037954.1 hydrogenase/urease nickel incorporation protein HypA [Helicobacter anatolicus]
MHEYSVVASLIELCEENAKKHHAKEIKKIVVSIGVRSGMDKSLFISAFETFREESIFCKDSLLEIIDQCVVLECKGCKHQFETQEMEYGICPKCQENDLQIIKGTEMFLMNLELLQEEDV